MISVLLPSRGRPASLRRAIHSLLDNSANRAIRTDHPGWTAMPGALPEPLPPVIEAPQILVAADPDDPATRDAAERLGAQVLVTPRRYGYGELHRYLNALAEQAEGEWLLLFNDDAVMRTRDWDQVILGQPANVMVADLQSQLSPEFCCFPAVRRVALEVTGGVYSPHTPHADSWWQDIGRRSGTIRAVDVHVHHDRFDLTGGHNDATYREGRAGPGLRDAQYFTPRVQAAVDAAAAAVRGLAA
ncbi:glycosyltransferase family 2 protein [Rhizomonospora bruguierae]|uniref:glycosyltransferase family 2 protein n=1 Tax=Rhizomonospora bruguierae TaxID=1581705 RepID=UPI001BCC6314|nr:hypothetical protein [Micromonospora sp. NBRC 107566]